MSWSTDRWLKEYLMAPFIRILPLSHVSGKADEMLMVLAGQMWRLDDCLCYI